MQFGSLEYCAVGNVNGLVANLTGDRFANDCLFVENPAPGDEGCHLQFGPNVDFPQRPADGSIPHYAFNCGWTSGNVPTNTGLLPENAANGATNCYCEDSTATHFGATVTDNGAGVTLSYDGVCLSGESARAAAACEGAGWSLTSDSKGWQCAIPVMRGTLSAGSSEGCYLSGVATVALPQCSEVFGGSFAFPAKPTGTAPRYVFDCGTKMTPEGANLDGATICECAATNAQGQCICGGGRVERPNPEGGTHCVCIRNTAEVGGICVNREGPIGGVSEGLAAQVTLCAAFGGEVLATEGTEDTLVLVADAQEAYDVLRAFAIPVSQNEMAEAFLSWLDGDDDYWNTHSLASSHQGQIVASGSNLANNAAAINNSLCTSLVSSSDAQPYLHCLFQQIPQGGITRTAGVPGVPYGCRGVDKSGTFCLLGSLEVFPCRGLFTRARDCNIKYNRPLLNPFLCAPTCPPASPPAAPSANNPAPPPTPNPPKRRPKTLSSPLSSPPVVPKRCLGMRLDRNDPPPPNIHLRFRIRQVLPSPTLPISLAPPMPSRGWIFPVGGTTPDRHKVGTLPLC